MARIQLLLFVSLSLFSLTEEWPAGGCWLLFFFLWRSAVVLLYYCLTRVLFVSFLVHNWAFEYEWFPVLYHTVYSFLIAVILSLLWCCERRGRNEIRWTDNGMKNLSVVPYLKTYKLSCTLFLLRQYLLRLFLSTVLLFAIRSIYPTPFLAFLLSTAALPPSQIWFLQGYHTPGRPGSPEGYKTVTL